VARTTVYNTIVTEAKWNSVCNENKELLEEFKEYLQSTDKSNTTMTAYSSDIRICYIWGLENNKNKFFIEFNKRDIMKYQNYLLNTLHLSSNRIRRLKASLSSMSNFIENIMDDIYPDFRNIINKIPSPCIEPVREKTVLTDEQAQILLDELVKTKQYQKACSFALAWASGSRKSELLRFKVSYFKDEYIVYGSLYKTPEKVKTKGRSSKGKLLFKYSLVNKIKPYFDLWMEERKRLGIPDEIDDLFVAKKKEGWQPLKLSSLSSWAEKFSSLLNLDFYFHCLRHNFTTGLSASGIPASVIKEIVGWSNVAMVEIYDDQQIDDKLGKYFDENGIKKVEKTTLGDL